MRGVGGGGGGREKNWQADVVDVVVAGGTSRLQCFMSKAFGD